VCDLLDYAQGHRSKRVDHRKTLDGCHRIAAQRPSLRCIEAIGEAVLVLRERSNEMVIVRRREDISGFYIESQDSFSLLIEWPKGRCFCKVTHGCGTSLCYHHTSVQLKKTERAKIYKTRKSLVANSLQASKLFMLLSFYCLMLL
jgi:hypothetical protein